MPVLVNSKMLGMTDQTEGSRRILAVQLLDKSPAECEILDINMKDSLASQSV
jgi:hypothetical protein